MHRASRRTGGLANTMCAEIRCACADGHRRGVANAMNRATLECRMSEET